MPNSKPKVLIVDDDPVFQMIAAGILTSKALVDVVSTEDPRTAIKLATDNAQDLALIVLDLNMPDCDGIELLQKLAALGCRSPLLIVSGAHPAVMRSAEIIARAVGLTVLASISKPIKHDVLWSHAASVLAQVTSSPEGSMAAA